MSYLTQTVTAQSVEDNVLEQFRFKGMLVGQSKTGKTTLACTLPGKKLLIDTDNRWQSIAGKPDIEVLPILDLASSQSVKAGTKIEDLSTDSMIRAWNILVDVNNELWLAARKKDTEFPAQGLILDGLSSLNRLAMQFVLSLRAKDGTEIATGPAGAPSQPHYGPQMHILSQLLFSLKALPCHFILTGHLELWEDRKSGAIMYYPRMYGKTRNEIGSWFDETWETDYRYDTTTRSVQHIINTVGEGNRRFIGSSLNKEGKVWQSPITFDLNENPCGIAKLINLRFSKKGGESNDPAKSSMGLLSRNGDGKTGAYLAGSNGRLPAAK